MDETGPDQMVSAWRALSARHAAVCSALERELGERHGLGVSDFEVLERLAESVDHQFRSVRLPGVGGRESMRPAVRGALTRAFAGSRKPDGSYRQENLFRYLVARA